MVDAMHVSIDIAIFIYVSIYLSINNMPPSLWAAQPFEARAIQFPIAMLKFDIGQALKGLDGHCLTNEGDDGIGHA